MARRRHRPSGRSRPRDGVFARRWARWTEEGGFSLAEGLVWLVVLVAPLAFSAALQDSFRLPKRLATETFALASLAAFAWRLRAVDRIDVKSFLKRPVVRATAPLLIVASLTWWTTAHRAHVAEALIPFWIALGALVVWSAAMPYETLRALVAGSMVPAGLLAVVACAQGLGWIGLAFVDPVQGRLALTSLAGNPFDLASFLVLPLLAAQAILWQRAKGRAWPWAALCLLLVGVIVATQTISALLAVVVGSAALWLVLLPRRRFWALALVAILAGGAAAVTLVPLRARVEGKLESLAKGDWNDVLTGRLDAWRAARWMLETHPWTGVGHGAFRAEFAGAKLALAEQGTKFYRRQDKAFFDNAHSEILGAGAAWGWPGLVALAWAVVWLGREASKAVRHLCRQGPSGLRDGAVIVAGLVAVAVLAATNFPLHLAAVAFGFMVFLAATVAAAERASQAPNVAEETP